jgi:hypothetical protein
VLCTLPTAAPLPNTCMLTVGFCLQKSSSGLPNARPTIRVPLSPGFSLCLSAEPPLFLISNPFLLSMHVFESRSTLPDKYRTNPPTPVHPPIVAETGPVQTLVVGVQPFTPHTSPFLPRLPTCLSPANRGPTPPGALRLLAARAGRGARRCRAPVRAALSNTHRGALLWRALPLGRHPPFKAWWPRVWGCLLLGDQGLIFLVKLLL